MKQSLNIYQNEIRNNFSFLKQTTRMDDLYAKSIILKENKGFLLPICELHMNDSVLIDKLTQWRQENLFAYPSQCPVTKESTMRWLRNNLLDVEDRILFLVMDNHGYPVGHLGLANGINDKGELEIDNVIRGMHNTSPGIMSAALDALINWAEEIIGPFHLFLRVFTDNSHAISFYKKSKFNEGQLIPLRKHQEENGIFYRPIADTDKSPPDTYFLRMDYVPENPHTSNNMILTAGPSVSAREVSYVVDAARNGWNNQWGKYIKQFETTFADYLEMKHALSTSSCTGALHIALTALGIGPGDEVIVPDITWVATANAVAYVGATPVFADIDKESWCMEPSSFESLINEKTKAVIPVHLYGHPAPMDKITSIALKHNLFIIEDAAPSIGAKCNNTKVGTFGDFAAFSFQGAKLTVTGEGGMLVTNNDELFAKAYAIWDQGREPGTFWIKQNGLKYKMANLQAAFGLGQMERVDRLIEAKRRIFTWYTEGLEGLSMIKLNYELPWAYSIYWMISVLLTKETKITRDQLREELKKRNIDTRPIFPAISQYPHWPKKQSSQPTALYVSDNAINLPSGVCLKRGQVDYICRCLREILNSGKQ